MAKSISPLYEFEAFGSFGRMEYWCCSWAPSLPFIRFHIVVLETAIELEGMTCKKCGSRPWSRGSYNVPNIHKSRANGV